MSPALRRKLFLVSLAFAIGLASSPARADDERVSLVLSPENPKPNQTVTAELVSRGIALSSSRIAWTYGGKSLGAGTGKTRVSFVTGAAGERKTLSIIVQAPGNETVEKSVVIVPTSVALLWEANDSYVPPFYTGKALLSSQGRLRIAAMPNIRSGGAPVKNSSLIFTWKRDDDVVEDASGVGRDVFALRAGYAGEETISVEASTLDGALTADGFITIPIGAPLVLFYEDKPLGGIDYEEALPESIKLVNQEVTLLAEPYFASMKDGVLSFDWALNGASVPSAPGNRAKLILRLPQGKSGSSIVSAAVRHSGDLLQKAERALTIHFGE